MASAVDSRLAYARLSAVATASRLPTANRGSNNSYTTSSDTTVLAGTAILENTLGHLSQAEGIVKLPVGEQPGIRGDLGTVEFKLQSTVKNDPKAPRFRFTHRVCHIRRSMYATTS